MRQRKAEKPFHAIYRDGVVIDVGHGDYTLHVGQTALEFETVKDRALHPDVAVWERKQALMSILSHVERMKSQDAYAAKYAEAKNLIGHTVSGSLPPEFVYDASEYPYLEIDVSHCGCTALEAAYAVIAAVSRTDVSDKGTVARESDRVALREYAKQALAELET